MNPHSCNSQRILSPSCLPFHHPGSLACIEDRKVPQSYVFLRNSAIISILFAFVVFLGIPCPRLARQGRTLLRISHTQASQRVSQLRSLFAFSTLLVSRLPLNPQLSTLNHRPSTTDRYRRMSSPVSPRGGVLTLGERRAAPENFGKVAVLR